MVNFDKAFFDIDIGGAVFAHGAELDKVAGGGKFFDGIEDVERADDVVSLGEDGVLAVDHGIGRGTLLGEVDDGLRLEVTEDGGQRVIIRGIANAKLHLPAGDVAPRRHALMQRIDGGQAVEAAFEVEIPARQVIEDEDIVSLIGQIECLRPAKIAVTAQYQNTHTLFLID